MKKVYIEVHEHFDCCTDCPLAEEVDGEDYCRHPKSAGRVTEYYNDQCRCHPECPLPSIPKNANSLLFIEKLIFENEKKGNQNEDV